MKQFTSIFSKHPLNILKELPQITNKRITNVSCNHDNFDAAKTTYKQGLHNNGFNEKLKHENKGGEKQTRFEERRKRIRRILWFNSPFSLSVKTSNGKLFFKILK